MRLTRHNGRAGKHGTYNPKHNDRSFDLENSEHINAELAKKNVYWDCYNGFRSLAKEELLADTFEEVEEMFYSSQYRNHVESQNQRNEKNRHPERNRTTSDLLKNKKTAPEETIFQIGTIDNHVPPEILLQVVTDFLVELDTRFGKNVHILDWALHLDEGTPHIHERHVFDCENSYGEVAPQQEKALEELGFELPDPTQKPSKINNRKKTFDSVCRVILFNITKKYGLDLEEEPEYGGRAYLEKQDYKVSNSAANYRRVLQYDPLLKGAIRKNLLTERIDIVKPLGWYRENPTLTDIDIKYLLLYFEVNYGLTVEKKIQDAVMVIWKKCSPVTAQRRRAQNEDEFFKRRVGYGLSVRRRYERRNPCGAERNRAGYP